MLLAPGFCLPASGFRLPASGFRLPASGFQLPARMSLVEKGSQIVLKLFWLAQVTLLTWLEQVFQDLVDFTFWSLWSKSVLALVFRDVTL